MIDDEIGHILDLIRAHTRRLRVLERHAAEQGRSVDPSITIEIQDITEIIDRLRVSISSTTPNPAEKSSVAISLTKLPIPLEKYDSFFLQLSQGLDSWDRNAKTFRAHLLACLADALSAKCAFIVYFENGHWEVLSDSKSREGDVKKILSKEHYLRELLHFANKINADDKEDPAEQSNVRVGFLPNSAEICLFSSYRHANPAKTLLIYDMNTDFELDTVVASTINALFRETQCLDNPPKIPEKLEMSIYNTLRINFGYVSKYVYERQLELFKRRLAAMTVVFEPTIALFNPPTISGWEALARDSKTDKAPHELFTIAELWGSEFLVELDIYFLRTAIKNFVEPEDREPYFRRPSDIQDLSVNVYPDTLVRRAYREAFQQIIKEGKFPLNRLILEISEKRALPLPEPADEDMDQIKWFRRKLNYYVGKGIRFAVDDFGVGHASSSRLSRLRTAVIKIDRDALLDIYGEHIFEYVVSQALETSANTQIVVEGLDEFSNFSLAELYKLGIQYVQGHALAKPKKHLEAVMHFDLERGRLKV